MSQHNDRTNNHDPDVIAGTDNGHSLSEIENPPFEVRGGFSVSVSGQGDLEAEGNIFGRTKMFPRKLFKSISNIFSYINLFRFLADRICKSK